MRKSRGLSFLELLLAMTVAFLAVSFLIGMFASALRNNARSQSYSTAALLAQSKMERLGALPVDQISPGGDNFAGSFAEYTYQVDVAEAGDYDGDGSNDPDLKMVTLTVTSPDKVVATLVALRPLSIPYYGVAAHDTLDQCYFGSDVTTNGYPRGWDDSTGNLDPTSMWMFGPSGPSPNPNLPNGGQTGAIAANPDLTQVWAVDYVNNGMRFISQASPSWGPVVRPPALGLPTGLAGDSTLGSVWLGDNTNKCLWRYSGGTWSAQLKPVAPDGLLSVKGVTTCASGTEVWVADEAALAIRRYFPSGGVWDPVKHTNAMMKPPVGVAVNDAGDLVFVMDSRRLHWFNPVSGVWNAPLGTLATPGPIFLPSKLRADGPHSLSCKADGSMVWASCYKGLLFRYDVNLDDWDELVAP